MAFIHKHHLHHQPSKPSSSDSPSPSIDTSTMQRTRQSQTLSSSRQQQRRRRRRKKQPVASTPAVGNYPCNRSDDYQQEQRRRTSEKNNYLSCPKKIPSRCFTGVGWTAREDELVRTIQKCCPADDRMAIIPPTVLLPWDVSREEC